MAKAIILTDTHLHQNNIDINKIIYFQAIEYAKKLNLKQIFHAGDIFDSRKAQPLNVLNAFEYILDMFLNNNIKLIAIPGNHDKNDYTSENSFLDPFKYHPAFDLYDYNSIITIDKEFDIALIPFFSESDSYIDYLKRNDVLINKDKKTFLLTHIAANGVRNNDGSEVANNITLDLFKNYDKVLTGHYHHRSIIGNKIIYIGSAFQHNFGEDSNKGFCIIEDNFDICYKQSDFPEYKKVIIDLNLHTPKEAEKLISEFDTKNDNIRFVFKGTFEQINSIDKNKFKKEGVDVKLESSEIQINIDEAAENKFVSFDNNTIEKEFDIFCETNSIVNLEIGKNYLKQILTNGNKNSTLHKR